jgi:hypothetical protein
LSQTLGLQAFRLKVGEALPPERFDLYVFDGQTISGTLPAADLLLINPPSNELFQVSGTFTNTSPVRLIDDPLTRFVDWSGVHLLEAERVELPTWARPLVQSDGGALVFVGEAGGRRVAVLTFDLHNSDLPLQVSFPILMANLLGYLSPAQAFSTDGLRPGQPLSIKPGAADQAITVVDPAGQAFPIAASESGAVFVDTLRLGLYTVRSDQRELGQFAVNLFDPNESRIGPSASIRVGRSDVSASARAAVGQYEIWPWLAALGLLILIAEWWIYHRGTRLRLKATAGP